MSEGTGGSGEGRGRGRGRDRPRLRSRIRTTMAALEERAAETGRKRDRIGAYLWRLGRQMVRQLARDRCPEKAASLAFQTLVSMVPALAVMLAVVRAAGATDAESAVVEFLSERLVPVSRDQIAGQIESWSQNVTFESLGLVGLIGVVIVTYFLMSGTERAINHIWRVTRKRSLIRRLLIFYASATLGPLLIGASFYFSAAAGLDQGVSHVALSLLLAFIALVLANYFLPGTRVELVPALVGALFTTLVTEVVKFGFTAYVSTFAFSSYHGIYGTVAAIPLLMIWIYWSWLMFLFGVEIAHAIQNVRTIDQIRTEHATTPLDELFDGVTGAMAARVMERIAVAPEQAVTRRELADHFDLSSDALRHIEGRLAEAGLVRRVDEEREPTLALARPASHIDLAEILRAFRPAPWNGASSADAILAELEEESDRRAAAITLADLVAEKP